MPTLKQIRDDLKEIQYYYSKKNELDKAFETVVINDIFDKVNRYNEAIKAAPVRLFNLYFGLYVNNNTQLALSVEWSYSRDHIRELNRMLCEFFQKAFAKEKCSELSGKGGEI